MTVDSSGNIVTATGDIYRVRVVAATTGTFYGQPMTAGDLYTAGGNGQISLSGNDGGAVSAELDAPTGIAEDGTGDYAIVDHDQVRLVPASTGTFFGRALNAGRIYGIAGTGHAGYSGDGGPARSARLRSPRGAAFDSAGNLLIADAGNNVVRVVAASTGTFYGQAMAAGDIYTIAGNGTGGGTGDGGPATSAELSDPAAVAADGAGNVAIADQGNNRVRVVAESAGTFYGQAMTAGDIYTIAGTGTAGGSGDGGPGTAATLRGPGSVTADAAGNLVIADTANNRDPGGGRVERDVLRPGHDRRRHLPDRRDRPPRLLRRRRPGGPGPVGEPRGITADGAGNLVIADTANNRVRVVAAATGTFYGQAMTAGDIYTIAGNGQAGFSGDGGAATGAQLSQPGAVAVDPAGDILVADTGNNRVREVGA